MFQTGRALNVKLVSLFLVGFCSVALKKYGIVGLEPPGGKRQ
jgi:hypothetical protein